MRREESTIRFILIFLLVVIEIKGIMLREPLIVAMALIGLWIC